MADPALEKEFKRVVLLVQNLPKEGPYKPSTDEKLKFYSLYKQATEGPVKSSRPGILDFVGKAKWDAWNALGDMSNEEAMRQYIAEFKTMENKMNELGFK